MNVLLAYENCKWWEYQLSHTVKSKIYLSKQIRRNLQNIGKDTL
jgi:hypothetical protein